MNTQANNKLIAEFMGNINKLKHENTFISPYCYNSSWDWLMPVIEKILNLKEVYAQQRNQVFNSISPNLESTYQSVIDFINWYNQTKFSREVAEGIMVKAAPKEN